MALFIRVIADSVTFTYEALAMTSIYFVYVGTVVGMHLYTKLIPRKTISSDRLGLFSFLNTPDSVNGNSSPTGAGGGRGGSRYSGNDMLGIQSEHLKRNPLIDDALGDTHGGKNSPTATAMMRLADVDMISKVLDKDLEDIEGTKSTTGLLELEEDFNDHMNDKNNEESTSYHDNQAASSNGFGVTMLTELQKELQPLDLEQMADNAWQIGAGYDDDDDDYDRK